VRFGVLLRCFVMMVFGVEMMPVRRVRVMRGLRVIAGFVMLCSLLVMVRCVLAVFGGVLVMLRR
jgi:hypothetical protein